MSSILNPTKPFQHLIHINKTYILLLLLVMEHQKLNQIMRIQSNQRGRMLAIILLI